MPRESSIIGLGAIHRTPEFDKSLCVPCFSSIADTFTSQTLRNSDNEAMNRLNLKNLQSTVSSLAKVDKSKSIETQTQIVRLCKKYLRTCNLKSTDEPQVFAKNSINNIIKYKKTDIDEYLLGELRKINANGIIPSPVVKEYITMDPKPPVSKILGLIKNRQDLELIETSLRLFLYKYGDYDKAFQLLKQNDNSLKQLSINRFRNDLIKAIALFTGLNYSIGLGLDLALSNISLIELYAVNFIIFKKLLFEPLFYSSAYISWIPGVSNWKRITQYNQFLLYSKTVGILKECYYLNVTNYDLQSTPLVQSFQSKEYSGQDLEQDIIKNLRKEGFMLISDEKEELFRDYWDSGGDGFEWVEPERDPVDFIDISAAR